MTAYLITSVALGVLGVLAKLICLATGRYGVNTAGTTALSTVISLGFIAWASYLLITQ